MTIWRVLHTNEAGLRRELSIIEVSNRMAILRAIKLLGEGTCSVINVSRLIKRKVSP